MKYILLAAIGFLSQAGSEYAQVCRYPVNQQMAYRQQKLQQQADNAARAQAIERVVRENSAMVRLNQENARKAREGEAALSGMIGRYQLLTYLDLHYQMAGRMDPLTGLPVRGLARGKGGVGEPRNNVQLFDTVTGNYYVMPKGEDRLWHLEAKLK
jgi:hypothetical protein